MEKQQVSSGKIALNYGLIFGVILIIFSLILFILDVGIKDMRTWGYVSYVFIIAGMFLGMKAYRDKTGFLTYGKAFGLGFLISLYAFIILAIYNYIYFTVINPGIVEEILLMAEEQMMETNPNLTDADLETALAMTKKFTSPLWMTIWGLVVNAIVGLLLSLIVSLFMVKKETPAETAA
ncbi:MAG: DUF4199 domain-containing protein [Bacteroidetes bacterium]|nr:DUF4199 domain-containing protein [Bacteroidota bacterium]